MAQRVNIRGFVSGIDIERDEFMLPLHEVIVNSIQSIEDKTDGEKGMISVKVVRGKQMAIEGEDTPYLPIQGFEIYDNGVGFNQARSEAFNELFTDINFKKGCKGVGRYTVLACFGSMEVDSTFTDAGKWFNRKFSFDVVKGVSPEGDESLKSSAEGNLKTVVKLNNYKKPFQDFINSRRIELIDLAQSIIEHCLLYFLSQEVPTIRIYNDNDPESSLIVNDRFRDVVKFDRQVKSLKLNGLKDPFNLSYVKDYNFKSHSLHLCANKREVGKKTSLANYIPSFVQGLEDEQHGKYFVSIYVTSPFLDAKANNQRNKFTIPQKNEEKSAFDEVSLEELLSNISDNVREQYSDVIESAEKEKTHRIQNYILNPKKPRLAYKHLLNVTGVFNDIPANASDERLESELHRKSYSLEQKRNKAFERAFAKKKYDKDEFSEIVHNVLKEEAAFSAGKLADLMVRRKSVIKLFRKYLEWRSKDNYMLEEDLHNIIFTMGAESNVMPSDFHNLWLLDERLTFHGYTTSDKQLRTNKHLKSDSQKETDLLIYDFPWVYADNPNSINSVVVFEFKRPGRDMKTNKDKKLDSQVVDYFELLMRSDKKSDKGKYLNIEDSTPKFGYIICDLHKDLIDFNVKHNYFKRTPYNTLFKINPELNQYFEVMSYETMIEFAEKRHDAFFQALGIDGL